MSKNFAVIENDKVINVIVADTIEIAEEVTLLECIECDGSFWIDWVRIDGQWVNPNEIPPTVE
jgi:hypothetical protein